MSCFTKFLIICSITYGIIIPDVNASQDLNLSGRVMDLSGSPVSGATVKVKDVDEYVVTDKDGNFSISGIISTIVPLYAEAVQPDFAFLGGGKLEIHTLRRTLVSITGFNLSGKTIFKRERLVGAGVHLFSTPSLRHGVTFFKVTADGRTALLKAYTLGGMIQGRVQGESSTVFSGASAKQTTAAQAFRDTIFVTKEGYLEYATRIHKKEIHDLNIRLAKEDLPKMTQKHIYKIGSAPFRECHASTILELPDGTLLSAFFGGSAEGVKDVEIRLCRKEPGKDWTAPESVADGMLNGKRYSVGNPALFQTFDGKIILFYKILPINRWGAMKTSTDGGKTWSEMRNICKKCIGPEKNKPVQLEDGTILSPSSDRNGGSGIRVEVSKDNGETWSTGKGIGGGIQPTIMLYGNNRLQMMFRTGDGRPVGTTWSEDNGKSWSKPSGSVLPNNNSGLDAITLRDGRQLLAYNHSHSRQAEMGHKGRGFLNVSVSKDGKAWEAALIVNYTNFRERFFQFSYPAVIQSRNGLVHLVHTWGRLTINHVVINPKALNTEPIPDDGKWPGSGPLSLKEWKKANPDYDNPEH